MLEYLELKKPPRGQSRKTQPKIILIKENQRESKEELTS